MSVIDRVAIAVTLGIVVLVIFFPGALAARTGSRFCQGAVFNWLGSNGDGILIKEEVMSAREQMFERKTIPTLPENRG
jgi:hypothetical protein